MVKGKDGNFLNCVFKWAILHNRVFNNFSTIYEHTLEVERITS